MHANDIRTSFIHIGFLVGIFLCKKVITDISELLDELKNIQITSTNTQLLDIANKLLSINTDEVTGNCDENKEYSFKMTQYVSHQLEHTQTGGRNYRLRKL